MIYGSIAKGRENAASDVDLLIVADALTLEEVYAVLAPVETVLDRRINPTLYTNKEFRQRRKVKNPFLTRVLDGQTITLLGSLDGA
jgi:predicted nucleotidyltransferase